MLTLSNGVVFTDSDLAALKVALQNVVDPNPNPTPVPTPPPNPSPPPIVSGGPIKGKLLYDLLVMLARGTDDPAVRNVLGVSTDWYKNAYSTGGKYYNPALLDEAGRASGVVQPAQWLWSIYTLSGKGKAVNGVWVWDESTYPNLAVLKNAQ